MLGTAEALARNSAAGALEEDARLTALFLWTLQSTNGSDTHPGPLPAEEGENEEVEPDVGDEDDETPLSRNGRGDGGEGQKEYGLAFDVVRRFAQPLGIDLPRWEGRVIETKKGVVRLLSVAERVKQLFGADRARAVAEWLVEDERKNIEQALFLELERRAHPAIRGRRGQTLFIDARKMGRLIDRTHRELTDEEIARTYHAWRGEPEAGEYEDVPGFCKSATLKDIAAHGYVLAPGRYVGAQEVEDDGTPFEEKMAELSAELYKQMAEAEELDAAIRQNLEVLGYG